MRWRAALLILVTMCVSSTVHAQWLPNGIQVGSTGNLQEQDLSRVAPDGAGGLYVAWREQRIDSSTELDVYLQHVLPDGRLDARWPVSGFPVVTAPRTQDLTFLVADGRGAAVVVWIDHRDFSNDVYALRILPSGERDPNWTEGGNAICSLPGDQLPTDACSDLDGGAYIAWNDLAGGVSKARMTHVLADGSIAPGWPSDGTPLTDFAGFSGSVRLLEDADGCFVLWTDGRGATSLGFNMFALRLSAAGEILPGWPGSGSPVLTSATEQEVHDLVTDGQGGAFIAWNDNRNGISPSNPRYYDLYAQHILSDGTRDPRWPVDGRPICNAPDAQYNFDMAPDGSGGFLIMWEDYRVGGSQLYGQRVLDDGTPSPGWATNGMQISSSPIAKFKPTVTRDGGGGFYGFWVPNITPPVIEGQHMRGDGTFDPLWGSGGLRLAQSVSGQGGCKNPAATSDGAGGAYVSFERTEPEFLTRIHALRVSNDGPVPTLLSFVDSEVESGRVTLRWQSSDAASLQAVVERSADGETWDALGAPTLLGTDLLAYVDTPATTGRLGYRLRYAEDNGPSTTEVVWVYVSSSARLALEGFRPNPAPGAAAVAFTLAEAGPATLQVHDVRGRVVYSREVGSLGPGPHVVRMDEDASLAVGMYLIRLAGADGTVTRKGVVTR